MGTTHTVWRNEKKKKMPDMWGLVVVARSFLEKMGREGDNGEEKQDLFFGWERGCAHSSAI